MEAPVKAKRSNIRILVDALSRTQTALAASQAIAETLHAENVRLMGEAKVEGLPEGMRVKRIIRQSAGHSYCDYTQDCWLAELEANPGRQE